MVDTLGDMFCLTRTFEEFRGQMEVKDSGKAERDEMMKQIKNMRLKMEDLEQFDCETDMLVKDLK